MLVKHMIRELMKCDPEMRLQVDAGEHSWPTIKLDINHDTVHIISSYQISPMSNDYNDLIREFYDEDYDNTDDTPFPLPEKE